MSRVKGKSPSTLDKSVVSHALGRGHIGHMSDCATDERELAIARSQRYLIAKKGTCPKCGENKSWHYGLCYSCWVVKRADDDEIMAAARALDIRKGLAILAKRKAKK